MCVRNHALWVRIGSRRYVADIRGGELVPVGEVWFGFAEKGLWHALDAFREAHQQRHRDPRASSSKHESSYFGRYKRGWICDGVIPLLSTARAP